MTAINAYSSRNPLPPHHKVPDECPSGGIFIQEDLVCRVGDEKTARVIHERTADPLAGIYE
jgi:hypothetical protein